MLNFEIVLLEIVLHFSDFVPETFGHCVIIKMIKRNLDYRREISEAERDSEINQAVGITDPHGDIYCSLCSWREKDKACPSRLLPAACRDRAAFHKTKSAGDADCVFRFPSLPLHGTGNPGR